ASHKVDAPVYKVKNMTVDIPPGAEKPMPAAAMGDPVKKGFYLATIGHCMECHTPVQKGHRDFKGARGTGGERFECPWGVTVARPRSTARRASARPWRTWRRGPARCRSPWSPCSRSAG